MKSKASSLVNNLRSNQKQSIIEGLQEFRDIGKAEFLEEVIILLKNTKDEEISLMVENLLSEIKDQNAVPVLINAINDKKYINNRKTLLLACWQSGLDFSEHLPVFSEIVRTSNIETGLEAFTVAENFTENSSLEMIINEIIATKHYLKNHPEDNNILAGELLKVLEEMEKGKS